MIEESNLRYIEGTDFSFNYNFFDNNKNSLELFNKENILNFEVLKNGKVIVSEPISKNPYTVNLSHLEGGKYSYRVLNYAENKIIQFGRLEIIPSL
jgi:hypothetical protein